MDNNDVNEGVEERVVDSVEERVDVDVEERVDVDVEERATKRRKTPDSFMMRKKITKGLHAKLRFSLSKYLVYHIITYIDNAWMISRKECRKYLKELISVSQDPRDYICKTFTVWTKKMEQIDFMDIKGWSNSLKVFLEHSEMRVYDMDKIVGSSYEALHPSLRNDYTKEEWMNELRGGIRIIRAKKYYRVHVHFLEWRPLYLFFDFVIKPGRRLTDDRRSLIVDACVALFMKTSRIIRIYQNATVTCYWKFFSRDKCDESVSPNMWKNHYFNVGEVDTDYCAFPKAQSTMSNRSSVDVQDVVF